VKVLTNNAIVDGATTITPTSQLSTLPASNVQDVQAAKVWRAASATTERLVIDSGTGGLTANAFGIVGHNLQSGATCTLEANAADSWGAPSFSTTLVPTKGLPGLKPLGGTHGYRWWRLTLSDPTNPAGYVQLGRLMIGNLVDMDFQGRGPTMPWTDTQARNDKSSASLGGAVYTDIGEEVSSYSFGYQYIDTTKRNLIRSTFREVGKHTPFLFTLFDPPDADVLGPDYVNLTNDIATEHHGSGLWSLGLEFRAANSAGVQ